MPLPVRRSILAACCAIALAACSNPPAKVEPLGVQSAGALADAYVGSEYGEQGIQLAARGGTAPYRWALSDKPALLSWLDLDGNGKLIGVPTATTTALKFTATVTDAMDLSASATLELAVKVCRDGDRIVCSVADAAQCLQNTVLCSNGAFPACAIPGSKPSPDVSLCGAATPGTSGGACGACDAAKADSCQGVCKCGDGSACGAASTCCAGGCVDASADVANCGSCGTVCPTAGLPANSHPVCTGGGCGWACDAGFTRCGDACVDTNSDPLHCGSCSGTCTASASAVCLNGACAATCGSGLTSCNGACVDTNADMANCGGCTTSTASHACSAPMGGTAQCTGGVCTRTCPTGTALCGGACVNTATNPDNCGACGKVCGTSWSYAHATCSSGVCRQACNSGYKYCTYWDDCIPTSSSCPSTGTCLTAAQYRALVDASGGLQQALPVCP